MKTSLSFFRIGAWVRNIFSALKGRGLTSGVKARRVRRKPKSKRVKKARHEFGTASRLGVPIRLALGSCPERWFDREISGRLSGTLYQVMREGSGEEGQRGFEVANFGMLNRFPFHKKKSGRAYFCTDRNLVKIDRQAKSVSLRLTYLELQELFGVKLREFHSLGLGVMTLSEVHFDPLIRGYRYSYPEWNAQICFKESKAFGEVQYDNILEMKVHFETSGKLPQQVGLVGLIGLI